MGIGHGTKYRKHNNDAHGCNNRSDGILCKVGKEKPSAVTVSIARKAKQKAYP
jgi:hypothetical protein